MSAFKHCLIAGLSSALVTGGVLYGLHCRSQGKARDLSYQNMRLRLKANELHHSRQTQALSSSASARSSAESPPVGLAETGNRRLAEPDHRNEGLASPAASLQTFAWACERGDVETVRGMIFIDPGARVKVEALFAGMPANLRERWKTLDDMAASLLTTGMMNSPFPAARILEHARPEPLSLARVRMRLPQTPRDGTEYQKVGDTWKYVITEAAVDAYIAHLQKAQ